MHASMKAVPSLAFRLAAYLFLAQIIGVLATTLAIVLFVEDENILLQKNRNELATPRVYALILESLRRGPDGTAFIDLSSPGLASELTRVPTMSIAAFYADSYTPLPGSSAELVEELLGLRQIRSSHMHFVLAGEKRDGVVGHLAEQMTPYGLLVVASYGHAFKWIDVVYSLRYEIVAYLRYFLLAVLFAIAIGWIAFRRGLAPLDKVAREAERIDMDSLHQRLPMTGVPAEVAPLVESINKALTRLDQGAERQRRFLVNAAHELRTPVAILMERLDDPSDKHLLTKLGRDAERIRNIVEQLLATFRLDRAAVPQSTLDLREIVEGIVDDYALLGIKSGRHLVFEQCNEACVVKADPQALNSILANLVLNALRAEPPGGTVIVRVGSDATVEVVDHGRGVDPADRTMIFEPFWRKDEKEIGTGLGLTITKELGMKLGGSIAVDETPGGGATFKLIIPILTSPPSVTDTQPLDV
jgi:signal transduction histidine kinase